VEDSSVPGDVVKEVHEPDLSRRVLYPVTGSRNPRKERGYFCGPAPALATFGSTLVAGVRLAGGNPFVHPADLYLGLMFNVPLLSILGVHELGHYAAARHHRVDVTLPFFLPAPSFIGTFGAFIRIRSPIPDRNALFDVGVAGPLAGALVALPILVVGLSMSDVRPAAGIAGIPLGESLIFKAAARMVLGAVPNGYDVVLHPVAFAGWIGLFVTMLNLIPRGSSTEAISPTRSSATGTRRPRASSRTPSS
jgi:hypothetical protein